MGELLICVFYFLSQGRQTMKKIKMILCVLTFILCASGLASAFPTTWTDSHDWEPDIYVGPRRAFFYTYDITDGDNGFESYLMGGNDRIYSYSLILGLYDDTDDTKREREIAFIDQPGLLGDGVYKFNYLDNEFGWSALGIIKLRTTGKLSVVVKSVTGDFYVDYGRLIVSGDDGTQENAPVPEPATMILLGTGLIGLTGASRKKTLKK